MSTEFDSFTNRGEYLSAHYFAEQLGTDLKKGLFTRWTVRETDENDPRRTPRELVRTLRTPYLAEEVRGYFAQAALADAEDEARLHTYNDPEWTKRLAEWHQTVLRALGYDPAPTELTVHRAGRDHTVPIAHHGHGIIALDCGWTADNDSALNADGAGRLLAPFRAAAGESYDTGAALASWLFQSEIGEAGGPHPASSCCCAAACSSSPTARRGAKAATSPSTSTPPSNATTAPSTANSPPSQRCSAWTCSDPARTTRAGGSMPS